MSPSLFLAIYTSSMCSWGSEEEDYIWAKQHLANDKSRLLKSQSCIALFTQYSWSVSTMALSISSVRVHNSLNSQTVHSCHLFCAGISSYVAVLWTCSFSFFWWDKCSATLVRIPHCFGLYWLWNPPLAGRVFTISFSLCYAGEKRTSQK